MANPYMFGVLTIVLIDLAIVMFQGMWIRQDIARIENKLDKLIKEKGKS